MTTVVFQSVGSFIGGAIAGPTGAAIGRAVGALAGSAVDQKLFGEGDRVVSGPRLDGAQMLSSREGAVVPQTFGRTRLSGEVIWATRFEEVQAAEEQGGKGGPTVTTVSYSYFANFALALCEGEIGGIGRIWADGRLVRNADILHRVHRGGEGQLPDSLIEAKQAEIGSVAPAYRGTAYIVFERFALAEYGNRIPQISVEVIRPIGAMPQGVRAVSIIPAATEFGYDPEPVVLRSGGGALDPINAHATTAETDWTASLDALASCCPNVERASLVVAWFGDSLDAAACRIEPRIVETVADLARGERWQVAGLLRAEATPNSRIGGRAAYGGTPSDGSVRRAIADLAARGLAVTFNPFLLMDMPDYPWRGRIAPGADVADACAAFEAAYRPMILHYAALCRGTAVDLFLLGSELRGLTRAQAPDGAYPFVGALQRLAADVRAILGPDVRLSYGADWSEYGAHVPADGELRFPLDPLWADPNIDLVGIDNYLPLTDWREHGPNPDGARSHLDPDALAAGVEGGEYFDWYYANEADRAAGRRTAITDGAGEPWVYRTKDIAAWWSNPHHERIVGTREAQPTVWRPRSKPVAFLELGCPAVHAGANQPNVFFDAKSSESALPYHSDGTRDDEMQSAFLEAHFTHWRDSEMVDAALTHVWAWDARPWPAFPDRTHVWSDGTNWSRGHWLNGRAETLRIRDLIVAILERAGIAFFDVSQVEGMATGFVLGSQASPRAALEGVLDLYGIDAFERQGTLVFRSRGRDDARVIGEGDIVDRDDGPRTRRSRAQEADLPRTAVLEHLDPAADYQASAARSRRLATTSRRDATLSLPIVLERPEAELLVERWMHRRWAERETLALAVPDGDTMPGDAVRLPDMTGERIWRVGAIDEGLVSELTLLSTEPQVRGRRVSEPSPAPYAPAELMETLALALDLPLLGQPVETSGLRVAVVAKPWPGPFELLRTGVGAGRSRVGRVEQRATVGRLTAALGSGEPWRWDEVNTLDVELLSGSLSSAPARDVLDGANVAAVRTPDGWEVLQFREAVLTGAKAYRLRGLLRGQAGTEALPSIRAGSRFVLLNEATPPFEARTGTIGIDLDVVPANATASSLQATSVAVPDARQDLLPYRPVALRARRDGAVAHLTWTRRDRGLADDWSLVDVPMSERTERYRIVQSRAGTTVATWDVGSPETTAADARSGDVFAVAQLSALVGAGPAAMVELT